MDFSDSSINWPGLVASIADKCIKPWKHAVICDDFNPNKMVELDEKIELLMKIECRNIDGKRYPENDIDLEIFHSGKQLNLILSWTNKLDSPILWQGQHAIWMDGGNGQRCQTPEDGVFLETFARRLRSLFD